VIFFIFYLCNWSKIINNFSPHLCPISSSEVAVTIAVAVAFAICILDARAINSAHVNKTHQSPRLGKGGGWRDPANGGRGRGWAYDNDDTKVRDYQNAKQQAGNENA